MLQRMFVFPERVVSFIMNERVLMIAVKSTPGNLESVALTNIFSALNLPQEIGVVNELSVLFLVTLIESVSGHWLVNAVPFHTIESRSLTIHDNSAD